MQKKALLALLLAVTLMLSGCALVVKDADVDAVQEVIRIGDKSYTKGEIIPMVDSQLAYNAEYYEYMSQYYYGSSYGYDVTDPANISEAQDAVLNGLVENEVKNAHITAEGLDVLTEEETANIASTAQEDYDTYRSMVEMYDFSGSELEGDELSAAIDAKMEEYGYKLETFEEQEKQQVISDKLTAFVTKDVTVSDDEIKADFDAKVAADKDTYAEDASSYANAMNNGTTLYYAPEGVRLVKQILIGFHDEDKTTVSELETRISDADKAISDAQMVIDEANAILADEAADETAKTTAQENMTAAEGDKAAAEQDKEQAQKDLEAAKASALSNLDEEADAVLTALETGADWDILMAEKTADPGMLSGKTAETGYAVCEGMTNFDPIFTEAAMKLEKIGDVSPKAGSDLYGYYIIKYVGDVTPGEAEMTEEITTEIHDNLLQNAKDQCYADTIARWVEEAGAVIHKDILNN